MTTRIIGIRHRNKMTKDGENRPTALWILKENDVFYGTEILLQSEQDEIDWSHSQLPIKFRDVSPNDDPKDFLPWQLQWKKIKSDESVEEIPKNHLRKVGKINERLVKVPFEFIGLQSNDTVVMLTGGSGNIFGHLLSRVGEQIGAQVMRVSAARAKEYRLSTKYPEIEYQHMVLSWMYQASPEKFRKLAPRHRAQVEIEELYKLFVDVQDNRIACALRLYQHAKRFAFMHSSVETNEHVTLESRYKQLLASDPVHLALETEEIRIQKEALKIMKSMSMYTRILEPITGIGPRIALRLIASIPDIAAFETSAQFCAFCGVHALGKDDNKMKKGETPPTDRGGFPRRKRGVKCDWKPSLRQAFYLFDGQLNRNPDSGWGARRLQIKNVYREKHPLPVEEILEGGKKVMRYTDSHIQNMARWKTMNKFCRWFFKELKKLEDELDKSETTSTSKAA